MRDRLRAVECPADIIDQMAAGTGRVLGRAMVGDIRWSSCTVGWLRLRGSLGSESADIRYGAVSLGWLNLSTIKRNIKEA